MYIEICADGSIRLVRSEPKTRDKGRSLLQLVDTYTAIDIETTGLDSTFDEIIEIGAIKFINEEETKSFNTLIKPVEPIPD